MQENFEKCLDFCLSEEGGFVNNPKDPGGATNLGVTIGTLSNWRGEDQTVDQVRALTRVDVKPIYAAWYWNVVGGSRLNPGLDLMVFDFAVNAGTCRSAKILQCLVGAQVDGHIGPQTEVLANGFHTQNLISLLGYVQQKFYSQSPNFSIFGRGWTARTTRRVTLAQQMTGGLL